jgi:hypothetical protein
VILVHLVAKVPQFVAHVIPVFTRHILLVLNAFLVIQEVSIIKVGSPHVFNAHLDFTLGTGVFHIVVNVFLEPFHLLLDQGSARYVLKGIILIPTIPQPVPLA